MGILHPVCGIYFSSQTTKPLELLDSEPIAKIEWNRRPVYSDSYRLLLLLEKPYNVSIPIHRIHEVPPLFSARVGIGCDVA